MLIILMIYIINTNAMHFYPLIFEMYLFYLDDYCGLERPIQIYVDFLKISLKKLFMSIL